jgi:hypothetical protein
MMNNALRAILFDPPQDLRRSEGGPVVQLASSLIYTLCGTAPPALPRTAWTKRRRSNGVVGR